MWNFISQKFNAFISYGYHQWYTYKCSLESFGGIVSILEMLINTVLHKRSGKPATKAPEVQPDDAVLIAIRKLTKEVHELPKRVAEAIVTNPNQKANIDGP
ncbi:PREDICTED: uncharacterized protein LOC109593218 [Amphimedon queenslandica]|uniref:Uncharacterized protein n=1 Tax=Amphimedon queenslandica TaxID=400682 RepID=A0AAN0K355_AMPQE|nr:PREDICTED: uncharacterized protein LOC109593218 [Amphimedon queenslandica]|eukprot:XP_019863964.1 PREDICTED: uncharacterized protein LOC109593218 [Amphimedon queenslandica]